MTTPINLLEVALAEIDSVMADLEAAIPRMTLTATYGERTRSGSKTAPAPVNIDAVSAKHALHAWLMKTALRVGEPFGRRDIPALASHLLTHMPTIAANGWAVTLHNELVPLLNDCTNVTRVIEQKTFAGTCAQCSTDLYAQKDKKEVRCRTCGQTYEVLAWRAHAATAKEYHIGTPAELSRALTSPAYGIEVSVDQICKWAKRGKLERANEEYGPDGNPIKPTYKLKDVLDLNAKRKPLNGAAA